MQKIQTKLYKAGFDLIDIKYIKEGSEEMKLEIANKICKAKRELEEKEEKRLNKFFTLLNN